MTTDSRNLEKTKLYECTLSVEPEKKFITLKAVPNFRWKLPAEPDFLLPIICTSFETLQEIIALLAQATRAKEPAEKKHLFDLASQKALTAAQAVKLPEATTRDSVYLRLDNSQHIVIPRWIRRDYPVPPDGQTLSQSFQTLSGHIVRAGINWTRNVFHLLSKLDGFWEQLLRIQSLCLQSSNNGWSVYTSNGFSEDSWSDFPFAATELFNKRVSQKVDYFTPEQLSPNNLTATLELTPEDLEIIEQHLSLK